MSGTVESPPEGCRISYVPLGLHDWAMDYSNSNSSTPVSLLQELFDLYADLNKEEIGPFPKVGDWIVSAKDALGKECLVISIGLQFDAVIVAFIDESLQVRNKIVYPDDLPSKIDLSEVGSFAKENIYALYPGLEDLATDNTTDLGQKVKEREEAVDLKVSTIKPGDWAKYNSDMFFVWAINPLGGLEVIGQDLRGRWYLRTYEVNDLALISPAAYPEFKISLFDKISLDNYSDLNYDPDC